MSVDEKGNGLKKEHMAVVVSLGGNALVVILGLWFGSEFHQKLGGLEESARSLEKNDSRLEKQIDGVQSQISELANNLAETGIKVALLEQTATANSRELEAIRNSLADLRVNIARQKVGQWIVTDKARQVDGQWVTRIRVFDRDARTTSIFDVQLDDPRDPAFMAKVKGAATTVDPGALSLASFSGADDLTDTWLACSFAMPAEPEGTVGMLSRVLGVASQTPTVTVARDRYPSTFEELKERLRDADEDSVNSE